VTTYRRYVAIGDSSTEGLEDPDGHGGYLGWADRLAAHIADGQDEPLECANLAIRGYKMREIRCPQLQDALAMTPDLLTVFGGVNDVISPRCDFDALRAEFVIVFGEARRTGCTVASFTMPDPAAINPLAANLRDRVRKLNAIIRSEAERRGVLLVDFEAYPVAEDPAVVRRPAARQHARAHPGGRRPGLAARGAGRRRELGRAAGGGSGPAYAAGAAHR